MTEVPTVVLVVAAPFVSVGVVAILLAATKAISDRLSRRRDKQIAAARHSRFADDLRVYDMLTDLGVITVGPDRRKQDLATIRRLHNAPDNPFHPWGTA